MLETGGRGSVMDLDDSVGNSTVREAPKSKHPVGQPPNPEVLIPGPLPTPPHPVQFAGVNRNFIRQATLHTHGAAGPLGVGTDTWRHMCTSFSDASDQLCDGMAKCARRLATMFVDPISLEAYTACRFIPLDKNPGVKPIGIGEVLQRILGKVILNIIRPEIMEAASSLQLCAGQDAGIEAAIYTMRDIFDDTETEAMLLADATNAFDSLNREVGLQNVQHLCPALSHLVINTYRQPANLYVGGERLLSEEGTNQGEPVTMAMDAISIIPHPPLEVARVDGACCTSHFQRLAACHHPEAPSLALTRAITLLVHCVVSLKQGMVFYDPLDWSRESYNARYPNFLLWSSSYMNSTTVLECSMYWHVQYMAMYASTMKHALQ